MKDTEDKNSWREIEKKVVKWCTDEGIFKRHDRSDKSANFHIVVSFPENSSDMMDIVQPQEKRDLLVIASRVNVSPEHVSEMKTSNNKRKNKFYWEMHYLLGNRPTEFKMEMDTDFTLTRFGVQRQIYFEDGLQKDRFMTCLNEVNKSKLMGIWKVQEWFGMPSPGGGNKVEATSSPIYG